MSDTRLSAIERAARTGEPAAVRLQIVVGCRDTTGHEITGTHWIARGPLRNVHGCFCGTYNEPCVGPGCTRCGGRS